MTAKFISTMFRTVSVVAIPLAILTVSAPASAQRASERGNSEWHGKGHPKNPNYKNGHFKNKHYNNGRYTDRRERDDNDRDDNGGYNNRRDGNGQYGQYGQRGQYNPYPAPVIGQRPVYSSRGVTGKSLPSAQPGTQYPSRNATRYPSRVIPRSQIPPSGRAGKALPGAGRPNQQTGARHRGD